MNSTLNDQVASLSLNIWLLLSSLLIVSTSLSTSYAAAQEVMVVNRSLESLTGKKQFRISGYAPDLLLRFPMPAQWEAGSNGRLRLDYRVSKFVKLNSLHVEATTTLSAYLNEQPLETVPLTSGNGTMSLELPSEYLKPGENLLRLVASLPLEGDARCIKPEHPGRWIAFLPSSYLEMALVPRGEIPPLWEFPNQFIPLGQAKEGPTVTFVLPERADNQELSALSAIAYALVSSTQFPVRWQLKTVESFRPSEAVGPTILIGTVASNVHLAHLVPPDGRGQGWLAITRFENNSPLLAVGGPNSESVLKAARMLANPELRLGLTGLTALVPEGIQMPRVSMSETFTLADLGYEARTTYGTGEKSLTYAFYLPFSWSPQRSELELHYTHSRYLYEETSRLKILLNQTLLATLPIVGPESGAHTVTVSLPRTALRPGQNSLKFTFDLSTPTDHCGVAMPQGFSGSIGETTALKIPHGERGNLVKLERFPLMLTHEDDVARTAIVLPHQPTLTDISDALQVVRRLGVSGSHFPPYLWRAGTLGPGSTQFHLIVLGEWSRQPFLSKINPYLYLPFKADHKSFDFTNGLKPPFQEATALSGRRLFPPLQTPAVETPVRALGVAQAVRSPWEPSKVVVAITGVSYKSYRAALTPLLKPSLQSQVAGQLAVTAFDDATGTVKISSQSVADIGTVPVLTSLHRATAPLTDVGRTWVLVLLPLLSLIAFAAFFQVGRLWSKRSIPHQGGH